MVRPKVLAVDDMPTNTELIQRHFARFGIQVTVANSVKEALKLLRDDHDWVISDIDMPTQTGFDLIKNLKAINHKAKTIAFTAEPDHEERCMQEGFDNFHVKGQGIKPLISFVIPSVVFYF